MGIVNAYKEAIDIVMASIERAHPDLTEEELKTARRMINIQTGVYATLSVVGLAAISLKVKSHLQS